MGGKLLELDGSSIKFICEIKKQSTSSVHISNISDEYVAFKVKTTSPKRFCVRPNSGIISPKSECSFTVTMQGLRSHPSEVECKDKFLIQSTAVDSGTKEEDITVDLFSKSSGKYVEEKKLRVVLVSKQDLPVEEHKDKELEKEHANEEDSLKEHKHKVLEKEHSNEEDSHKEHKHKVLDKELPHEASHTEHKHKVLEKEPSNEASHKEQKHKVLEKEPPNEASSKEHKHRVLEKEPSNEEHKHEVLEKEPSNEASHKKEHKHKVLEKEPSNEASLKEHKHKVLEKEPSNEEHKHKVLEKEPFNEASHETHKPKLLEKEPSNEVSHEHKHEVLDNKPSNESSIKEDILVKRDKNVFSVDKQIKDAKEVKSGLTIEESKLSDDPNGNNVPKNSKFKPVKIVKEDPETRLRLSNQLKELKLKESALENQLKEVKSTISSLTYQNSIIIEAKETLQLELDRKSKKGFSFVFVCGVSLIGLIGGYFSDP
ncbi:unnamed protein product [Lactuca virosa]|uniref:MSP domain-containing protein n=1 Tax=Lactuca virosa TaxID=75947 RepID=A0AAU9MQ15_9ASTR|nr:unnamed protein product [Lactuca virosa]